MALSMVPFASLVIHEAWGKAAFLPTTTVLELSEDAKEVCDRARHSLKLFEDTHRGIDGQLDFFEREILREHSRYFLGNTWLRLARCLETDLGVSRYNGTVVRTTHSSAFHIGISPNQLLSDDGGSYVHSTAYHLGRCLGALEAIGQAEESRTFVSHAVSSKLSDRDVRAARYYGRGFNGSETPHLNGVLTDFQAMVNFATSVITIGSDPLSLEYTVFKIRYVTLYHVLASLLQLRTRDDLGLSRDSCRIIDKVTGSVEAQIITARSTRGFRNILVHYDPRGKAEEMDLEKPLLGLVPIFFPEHDFTSLSALVDQCARDTSRELNQWAAAR
ncbi:hypothetical protein ACIGBL_28130 [Streptomyces sp. NPDC085614]|uniref:hypothetical protein n=1 Tax=Streptomyces sp. NPDC085614 TaxID=3365733 RepID=UPI0037CD53C6